MQRDIQKDRHISRQTDRRFWGAKGTSDRLSRAQRVSPQGHGRASEGLKRPQIASKGKTDGRTDKQTLDNSSASYGTSSPFGSLPCIESPETTSLQYGYWLGFLLLSFTPGVLFSYHDMTCIYGCKCKVTNKRTGGQNLFDFGSKSFRIVINIIDIFVEL